MMKRAKKPLLVMLVLCVLLAAILPAARSYFAAEEPGEEISGNSDCAHEYGAWTPTGDGRHTAVCSLCGAPKTEDCAMELSITVPPTQTTEGYSEYLCPICGYTEQRDKKAPELDRTEGFLLGDVDGSGHIESSDARALLRATVSLEAIPNEILPYADMDVDGRITAADARSALRNAVQLEDLNVRHEFAVYVKTAATCIEPGNLNYICNYCGITGKLEIPTVNHNYVNPVVTPATCTAPGKSVAKCEKCGLEQVTTIPAKGHSWTGNPKTCSACGFTAPNWEQIGGLWYYYTAAGTLAKGRQIINGKVYQFDNNGASKTGRTGSDPKVAVIGDSLVETLGASDVASSNYDFYGKINLHADTIFTKVISGSDRVVIDEVKDRGYDIVIIILGENDLTYDASAWAEMYRDVIRGVKERAPGAVVYAHAVFPINDSLAAAYGYTDENNAYIRATNAIIKRVAGEEGVGYLDPTSVMADSSGQLPAAAAEDGVHFGVTYSRIWYNWLQTAM